MRFSRTRLPDAQNLEFPDDSFDTVTCTLGFCTIPDTRRAATEALRVLRPGGQLLQASVDIDTGLGEDCIDHSVRGRVKQKGVITGCA